MGRALCSENEGFACFYSQVYKALPEFNYPHSIQDEPCSFYWHDSKMETYKLFQVKPLPTWASRFLPIQEPPVLLTSAGKATPWQRTSLSCQAQAPSPLVFRSPGTTHCWNRDIPPAGCGGWTPSAFSQAAALKLFTNAKTRDHCPPRPTVVEILTLRGEHNPCAEKSKELVASSGCRALRGTWSHPENTKGHQRGWKRMEKDFGRPCAGCRQGPAET